MQFNPDGSTAVHILVSWTLKVGFDNYDFASFVTPSLTTIDQPLERIGATAFAQLRLIMEKKEIEKRNILLEATLIRRQST